MRRNREKAVDYAVTGVPRFSALAKLMLESGKDMSSRSGDSARYRRLL